MKKKPKKEKSDFAHAIIKSGLSFIPGPAAEIFNQIIAPPIEKRRDEWVQSIADDLLELQSKFVDVTNEKLTSNELFVSVFLNASQTAVRNHQFGKLEALKSAILNSAINISIDDDSALMFIRFIDELTVSHIKLLHMLTNPKRYAEIHNINLPNWQMGGVSSVISIIFPELKNRREYYDQLGQDLLGKGLIVSANFHNTITVDSMLGSHTTEFGRKFLEFIVSPLINE